MTREESERQLFESQMRDRLVSALRGIAASERRQMVDTVLAELAERERHESLLSKLADLPPAEFDRLGAEFERLAGAAAA